MREKRKANMIQSLFFVSHFKTIENRFKSKYPITEKQLFYLVSVHYYCLDNFYFFLSAISEFSGICPVYSHVHNNNLIEAGYIESYLPKLFSDGNSSRTRSRRGFLYRLTPKGHNAVKYLMRCYQDIYNETH